MLYLNCTVECVTIPLFSKTNSVLIYLNWDRRYQKLGIITLDEIGYWSVVNNTHTWFLVFFLSANRRYRKIEKFPNQNVVHIIVALQMIWFHFNFKLNYKFQFLIWKLIIRFVGKYYAKDKIDLYSTLELNFTAYFGPCIKISWGTQVKGKDFSQKEL